MIGLKNRSHEDKMSRQLELEQLDEKIENLENYIAKKKAELKNLKTRREKLIQKKPKHKQTQKHKAVLEDEVRFERVKEIEEHKKHKHDRKRRIKTRNKEQEKRDKRNSKWK